MNALLYSLQGIQTVLGELDSTEVKQSINADIMGISQANHSPCFFENLHDGALKLSEEFDNPRKPNSSVLGRRSAFLVIQASSKGYGYLTETGVGNRWFETDWPSAKR